MSPRKLLSAEPEVDTDAETFVKEKLRAARAAWADDAMTDHEALGCLLDLFEKQAGVEPLPEPEAQESPEASAETL